MTRPNPTLPITGRANRISSTRTVQVASNADIRLACHATCVTSHNAPGGIFFCSFVFTAVTGRPLTSYMLTNKLSQKHRNCNECNIKASFILFFSLCQLSQLSGGWSVQYSCNLHLWHLIVYPGTRELISRFLFCFIPNLISEVNIKRRNHWNQALCAAVFRARISSGANGRQH